ncbi:MAG TPA: U32 family peptidase [Candidatus Nanoarchaeia archaeon]|nr:U32 family peptidase [Candidatus Nanoarchaeia archaeon]
MHQIELNAPAGDLESTKAAICSGADAIYLSGHLFNARKLAGNFTKDQIKEVIALAHNNKVKVYFALNTLVYNREIGNWFKTLEDAYLAGIDAVIIQELFFVPYIRKFFPGLRIHASTQASLMNYHGINAFRDLDQVVLARELTLDDIREIRNRTKVKLEIFVHGHLCISYSGQCLISSFIGKRSGNRGICASSCRKQYNNAGYLISPKDLMLANWVDKIAEIGVDAVKIEGRMKSAEYVAAATKLYRKQIDSLPSASKANQADLDRVKINFNRDFTSGFFANNKSVIGSDMPMNRGILLGKVLNGKLRIYELLKKGDGVGFWNQGSNRMEGFVVSKMQVNGVLNDYAPRGSLISIPSRHFREGASVFITSRKHEKQTFDVPLAEYEVIAEGEMGKPLVLRCGNISVSSKCNLEKAKNNPFTKEDLLNYLAKSKKVGIQWKLLSFSVDPAAFMPFSEINQMRLSLDEAVIQHINPQRQSKLEEIQFESIECHGEPKLIVKVYSLDQVEEASALGPYAVYYDIFAPDVKMARKLCIGTKFFLDTPVVMSDAEVIRAGHVIHELMPEGICIGNWGMLSVPFKGEKHGKYSLNTFNDASISALLNKGILPIISPELSCKDVLALKNKNIIYYAHGQIPVMHFKGRFNYPDLKDEKGYSFPLRLVGKNTEMLYSRPIATFEGVRELLQGGIRYFLLDLSKDTSTLITAYQNIIEEKQQDISMLKKGTTQGNFDRGVA